MSSLAYRGQTLHFGQSAASIGRMHRAVKASEQSLLSRVKSIDEDAQFLSSALSSLALSLPVLVNLRCGRWYYHSGADDHDSESGGECYYKSSDGHCRHWCFSVNRLNRHVLTVAASHRGVIIVDSTRKGKLFPDSFTRTIPIWCCVVNRAIQRWRASDDNNSASDSDSEWDCELHTGDVVSESEKSQIEARLNEWVGVFLANTTTTIAAISATLRYPLLPVTIGRDTTDSLQSALNEARCHYTPLLLVNPSKCELEGVGERQGWHYIQGAGDDEANWSRGLTPRLYYQHREQLLKCDDTLECEQMVDEIVSEYRRALYSRDSENGGSERVKCYSVDGTNILMSLTDRVLRRSETDSGCVAYLHLPTMHNQKIFVAVNRQRRDHSESHTSNASEVSELLPVIVSQEYGWSDHSLRVIYVSGAPKDKRSLGDVLGDATGFLSQHCDSDTARDRLLLISGDDWTNVMSVATAVLCLRQATATLSKSRIRQVSSAVHAAVPGLFPSRLQLKQLNRFLLSSAFDSRKDNDTCTK